MKLIKPMSIAGKISWILITSFVTPVEAKRVNLPCKGPAGDYKRWVYLADFPTHNFPSFSKVWAIESGNTKHPMYDGGDPINTEYGYCTFYTSEG